MLYSALKVIHVGCAIASIAGFALRGVMMLLESPMLQARSVRIAPHVVDTLLLASALWLAALIGQYPFVQGWLTAKVLGLVAYIALGTVALKRARSKPVRAAAFALALLAAAYIVSVALTRDPLGFLALASG
jgi:uncharacterized membrane protein SirB2